MIFYTFLKVDQTIDLLLTTTAGLEPARECHNGLVIRHLNHSVKSPNIHLSTFSKDGYTTTTGLEPVREFRNRFLVYLLNHSDKLPPNAPDLGLEPRASR